MTEPLEPCPFCKGPAVDPRGNDVHCADEKCPGWNMRLCTPEKWNRRTVSVQEAGLVRYSAVIGRAIAVPDELRQIGDVALIWVNEGDLANLICAGKAVEVRALAEGERG